MKIRIQCDDYFTADFLRELANKIENSEEVPEEYETGHGLAELETED